MVNLTEEEEGTSVLNVDLDVVTRVSLEPFVAALGKSVFVDHVGREGRKFGAHVSLSSYGQTADKVIRELCALVRRLPNVVRLGEQTVALVPELRGTIVATTYAAPPTRESRP